MLNNPIERKYTINMHKALISSELKQIRIDLNLTQRQMSALLDVKLHNHVKYEQGKANFRLMLRQYSIMNGRKRLYNFDVSLTAKSSL